jgi:TPR repeat protein
VFRCAFKWIGLCLVLLLSACCGSTNPFVGLRNPFCPSPPAPFMSEQLSCEEEAQTPVDDLFCTAKKGNISAMEELADRYHAGNGLPREFPRAVTYYQRAARAGSAYAQFMLSIMYAEGRGVKPDLEKSVQWFKKASNRPQTQLAQFRVAKRYARGYGLPQNNKKAVYWYTLAADSGFAPAQIEMGDAYYLGRGEEQNYGTAFDWYLRAAEQNHSYAESMVGMMLLDGKGVEVNFPDALIWTERAAYQGARQAQYQLGRMYFYGLGVRQSDPKAYAWWQLALKDMDEEEPPEFQILVERMSPEMRAQAVKLMKEFSKRYVKTHGLPKI